MAVTQNEYTGNGSATTYSFTFPYLQTTDVKVKLDGVTQATTAYTFPTATTVQMNSAPGSNVKVLIYRDTGNDNKKATFYPGSAIKAEDLNDDFDQVLYTAQEIDNYAMTTLGDSAMIGNLQMGENQLVFEGDTADAHETSIGVIDPTADRTINFPDVSGNVVVTGKADQITSTELAPNSVDSSELVDGSIDTSHIADLQVTTAKIAADAVTGAKIADDQINSEHYVAGSIDTEHIADDQVTSAKIAANAVTTNQIIDDAVTADKLASNSVVSASIVDGTIVTGDLANSAVTQAKIADNAITTAKLNTDSVGAAQIIQNAVGTSEIAPSAVTTTELANDAVTTAKIADSELKTLAGMQGGTASILASGTALAATTTEINSICDGKTVQTTISDTDASYPTSGAVVDYVAAQIAPLGGLEVIGDEDSFPSQPASGVVISIADAGGIVVNGSGVSTTARTSGNGSDNVTINGFPSTLYSTTLTDNMGLLVSSTGSSNTYTYHKLLGKESDIKTLSDDINDFNARYRIASSAPSSNNDDGDLYFDTTAKKMKVYNGSTSQWDDVAQSSSSHIVTLSESFNGSLTDFTMSTAATDAQSTIVSINGVIQKPNSGTSTPAEGFAISGNTLKLSNAPATGSTYFVVVLGDTVSIGTPSDNTVATAKIQNLAVTTDKIAADAVTAAKIADDAVGAEHIEVLDANLQLADSVKIQVGTGNDLELYHDGDSSYINHITSGTDFVIDAKSPGDDLILRAADDVNIRVQGNETAINCIGDGAVELYYDDSKKFETLTGGASVTGALDCDSFDCSGSLNVSGNATFHGNLDLHDNDLLRIGAGDDLQIYHNGSHSYLDNNTGSLIIRTNVAADVGGDIFIKPHDNENGINIIHDGAVELYYDGTKQVETTANGLTIHDYELKVQAPAGSSAQLYLYGDNGNDNNDLWYMSAGNGEFYLNYYVGSGTWEKSIACNSDGGVELYYDNALKLHTHADGVKLNDNTYLPDNKQLRFGGDSDFRIFHTGGAHNYISSHTNNIYIQTPNTVEIGSTDTSGSNVETSAKFIRNGSVELYYNDTKVIEAGPNASNARVHGWLEAFWDMGDAGYIYDGTNYPFHKLQSSVNSWAVVVDNSHDSEPYGVFVKFTDVSPDDNTSMFYAGVDGAGYKYKVFADGDVWTSDAGTLTSDATLKENITDATSKLEDLKKLKVRNFNWKASFHPEKSKTKQIGFIAQEVEEVFPGLVTEHDISPDGLEKDHTPIMKKSIKAAWDPIIIKAMQELITKVETLETKVAALEAK